MNTLLEQLETLRDDIGNAGVALICEIERIEQFVNSLNSEHQEKVGSLLVGLQHTLRTIELTSEAAEDIEE